LLEEENIDIDSMLSKMSATQLKKEISTAIKGVLEELKIVEKLYPITMPERYLEMAEGFSISANWREAAEYYEKFIQLKEANWKIYTLQGIAYLNIDNRDDNISRLALKSFSNAIAVSPPDLEMSLRARLHVHRGVAFKRLLRLYEAESELVLAQRWGKESSYEANEIHYNLACVYALLKDKNKMLKELHSMGKSRFNSYNISSDTRYFGNYLNDKDFQKCLANEERNLFGGIMLFVARIIRRRRFGSNRFKREGSCESLKRGGAKKK
jgi:tetratricopeptide (TPR) repeat protein